MWNGTMFVDFDWPLNASSLLSASAELLVFTRATPVSEMTYTVSSGTLNPSIPYHPRATLASSVLAMERWLIGVARVCQHQLSFLL